MLNRHISSKIHICYILNKCIICENVKFAKLLLMSYQVINCKKSDHPFIKKKKKIKHKQVVFPFHICVIIMKNQETQDSFC